MYVLDSKLVEKLQENGELSDDMRKLIDCIDVELYILQEKIKQ